MNLDEIRARCEAATEGPWEMLRTFKNALGIYYGSNEICGRVWPCGSEPPEDQPDLDFIAHARQDIPDLIAEVERLKEQNDKLDIAIRATVKGFDKIMNGPASCERGQQLAEMICALAGKTLEE